MSVATAASGSQAKPYMMTFMDLRKYLESERLVLTLPEVSAASSKARRWCASFVGAVAWFTSHPNDAKYVWRGHASTEWVLQPRLHRHVARHLTNSDRNAVKAEEEKILEYARHNEWDYLGGRRRKHLEVLAILQHHGVPTRLLDVTRDPLVSMYFATEPALDSGGKEADGALIAIRDPGSEVAQDGQMFKPSSAPYAVWDPPPIDPRIMSQRAEFVVPNTSLSNSAQGDPLDPTADIGIGLTKPRGELTGKSLSAYFSAYLDASKAGRPPTKAVNVAMLVIPAKMKTPLRDFLEASGVTTLRVYPDLTGYASSFPPA